jgi:hypothetical protein
MEELQIRRTAYRMTIMHPDQTTRNAPVAANFSLCGKPRRDGFRTICIANGGTDGLKTHSLSAA